MFKSLYLAVFLVLIFAGCSVEPLSPVIIESKKVSIDYEYDIKPILDKRCVSCHSCYNSPCQLKLSSYEGLDRGSSKDLVYLAERLRAQDPTRLFIDAKSTKEWRKKGFSSVVLSDSHSSTNNSIMLQLLKHKMDNPQSIGEYKSEEDTTCAKDVNELAEFLDDNPHSGMPFGFPALSQSEYEKIEQWLHQGALSTKHKKTSKLKIITEFEEFLNMQSPKYIMTARYIYEHLFLAHLSFDESSKDFYEIVRSSTAVGNEIEIIPTVRPYDDPEIDRFYYRFRKINSTIVYKTHMVYDLSASKLQRYKELFIKPKWDTKPHVVGYKTKFNSQPFKVFTQIPAKSRYMFLLDNSEYIIRTFIRGPVCKGQIALNVIHDNFWIMFMNPEYDLSLKDGSFIFGELDNLRMPIEDGSGASIIKSFTDKYVDRSIKYQKNRSLLYDSVYKKGLALDSIYKGNTDKNSTPFLTIYRHFDSASVHAGALGDLPTTAWIIDYPLFERIYYALVAGFDVYGNMGHQVGIRRYMSRLRVEGETNFLNLLPVTDRERVFDSWYIDSEDDEEHYFLKNKSKIDFKNSDAKRELLELVISKHLDKSYGIDFDFINYSFLGERKTLLPSVFKEREDFIQGFRALSKNSTQFIQHVNGHNSNLAYLRIKVPNKKDEVISIVVNRWHDNVSFMFDEESRLDATKDSINFISGFIGSYPNYFFVVELEDLPDFFDLIENYDGNDKYMAKFLKYGINRGDKEFWNHYDWFVKRFYEDKPHEAGLFDLNRYYYKVFE